MMPSTPYRIAAIIMVVVMTIFFTWGIEIAIIASIPLSLSGKERFG
jgi:hypothetical protein